MTIEAGKTKAVANPTKAFFVRMITRDITLEDCILDLIDNSVDGAWRTAGSKPMGLDETIDLSPFSIKIVGTPDCFSIRDNCGGMTLDDAVEHAFSFGRPATDTGDAYSIGVYGIGMKRAVFKLGRDISVRSTFLDDDDTRLSFKVPIDVDSWLSDDSPPWDFDIVEADDLEENGVEIVVEELTSGSKTSFDSPAFIQNLRRTIARDYSLHLDRGLSIDLNGEQITGWEIELREGDGFAPMRIEYEDEVEGEIVKVELIGGMAAPPPDSGDPDVEDEGERRFGWYVVCNGRIVLAADKTSISGWGSDGWPQWHRQYSGFIGMIIFTAEDAGALPMTTTKRSVDTSSEVYRRARPKMREVTRAWINYTNSRKQSLEQAKAVEAAAKPVKLRSLAKRETVTLPRYAAKPVERVGNIGYSVPVTRIKKLARAMGKATLSYREVGLQSFEYAYDDLVGDE
ncbi:ATP-binding protein [Qipengyuania sp. NPDC077563]|uniref:ATP-binding protein n=1 Tax=Qipengyuania sp. NPDC077563 TaxID=3364497 RepID=UPI0038504076